MTAAQLEKRERRLRAACARLPADTLYVRRIEQVLALQAVERLPWLYLHVDLSTGRVQPSHAPYTKDVAWVVWERPTRGWGRDDLLRRWEMAQGRDIA